MSITARLSLRSRALEVRRSHTVARSVLEGFPCRTWLPLWLIPMSRPFAHAMLSCAALDWHSGTRPLDPVSNLWLKSCEFLIRPFSMRASGSEPRRSSESAKRRTRTEAVFVILAVPLATGVLVEGRLRFSLVNATCSEVYSTSMPENQKEMQRPSKTSLVPVRKRSALGCTNT